MLPDVISSASLCVSAFLTSVHQPLAYKTCLLRERRLRLGLGLAFPDKIFLHFCLPFQQLPAFLRIFFLLDLLLRSPFRYSARSSATFI